MSSAIYPNKRLKHTLFRSKFCRFFGKKVLHLILLQLIYEDESGLINEMAKLRHSVKHRKQGLKGVQMRICDGKRKMGILLIAFIVDRPDFWLEIVLKYLELIILYEEQI